MLKNVNMCFRSKTAWQNAKMYDCELTNHRYPLATILLLFVTTTKRKNSYIFNRNQKLEPCRTGQLTFQLGTNTSHEINIYSTQNKIFHTFRGKKTWCSEFSKWKILCYTQLFWKTTVVILVAMSHRILVFRWLTCLFRGNYVLHTPWMNTN